MEIDIDVGQTKNLMNNQYTHITHTFPAVFDKESKILILGSVPSVKSREQGFFYMHPQNRFWKVLSAIFNDNDFLNKDIEVKKQALLKYKVALYDVIESCDIIGSSDVSIKNVEPAISVIDTIINSGNIKKIVLNGAKSANLFDKYFNIQSIEILKMPSTSPANAAYSVDKLVECWKEIL